MLIKVIEKVAGLQKASNVERFREKKNRIPLFACVIKLFFSFVICSFIEIKPRETNK